MNRLSYPDKDLIKSWIKLLSSSPNFLQEYLPLIDENWYDEVMSPIEMVQFPYYEQDVHIQAAHIFYKLTKNHYFIDGNKRTAVVIIYLFLIINRLTFKISPEELKSLAKNTAEDSIKEIDCSDPIKAVVVLSSIFKDITISI